MGIISSLFGKKDNGPRRENVAMPASGQRREPVRTPSFHLKGYPDANGLYPSELVMLAVAEKYKTSETNYPAYLINQYEIANPAKTLKSLQTKGFIEVGSSKDTLPGFKLPELKEIAASLGIPAKGKKADIVEQLSALDEESLAPFVTEHTWKLTEGGQMALNDNPYIQYFLDKHPYNVTEVGVDIWTVNNEFIRNPERPYKDIIFKQLNDQMNSAYMALRKGPYLGNADAHRYCACYRLMGLFIEEEGRSYINAADLYFQYIYKRINVYGGLQLFSDYRLFKDDKEYQKETIRRFYDNIQLQPFQKTELLRLIDELDISGNAVREALITSFRRAKDIGVMTEQQAADFVIFELNGEGDRSRDLADRLAKQAVRKIR